MANVWDAIQKHQAEQGKPPSPPQPANVESPSPSSSLTDAQEAAAIPQVAAATQATPAQGIRSLPKLEPAPTPAPQPIHVASNGYASDLVPHHDRGSAITEQYRALRTNMLARCPDERFCAVVTSAEAGEGKTVTCLNLGLVLAELQDRLTIIVDGDLRRSKVASLFNAPNERGLVDVLRGTAKISEVIHATAYPNLFFVPAGKVQSMEVGELIGRSDLGFVNELRRKYDYVLIDTPPINLASDAGILGRTAGEALVVLRMNKTHRDSADRAMTLLHAANVKLSGMILTHQKYHIPNYLYRYS